MRNSFALEDQRNERSNTGVEIRRRRTVEQKQVNTIWHSSTWKRLLTMKNKLFCNAYKYWIKLDRGLKNNSQYKHGQMATVKIDGYEKEAIIKQGM